MNPPVVDSTAYSDVAGTEVQVDSNLKPTEETKYAIANGTQALAVARRMQDDWADGIFNTALITAQLNGEPPRSESSLVNMGRGWYPNVSTGSLRGECQQVPARFSQPILTALYLINSSLPPGTPAGPEKSEAFREDFTQTLRSWDKFQWWTEQSCREVGIFGFGFACYFDKWEWRPTFVRQDQGFIPIGTTIFDPIPRFAVVQEWQPWQLIELVEKAEKAGVEGWKKERVAAAINKAKTTTQSNEDIHSRTYEELIRQASVGMCYEKGFSVIRGFHVFSTDPDGSVSHQIVLDDPAVTATNDTTISNSTLDPLLFERRKAFDSMDEVVMPLVFQLDDGTIHGCWGAGQILFELSVEFEKTYNDWMASNRMVAKIKAQANDGVNADEVRLKVEDYLMTLQGATYAGNTAAVTTDPKPFQALLQGIGLSMAKKLGDVVPPIPLTPDDIRAAQMDQKVRDQQKAREKQLLNWLLQIGRLTAMIAKRLCKEGTPDDEADEFQKRQKDRGMSREEIDLLCKPLPTATIFDFTEYAIQKKAAFAAAKGGNPYYDQRKIERVQALAAGGQAFADYIMNPATDPVGEKAAKRQQQGETATMRVNSIVVDVLPSDNHVIHLAELQPEIIGVVQQGALDLAGIFLNHYIQHFVAGMATKAIPGDGNREKSFIFKVQKVIETGQLPPEGLEEQPDLLNQIQAQLGAETPQAKAPAQQQQVAEAVAPEQAG